MFDLGFTIAGVVVGLLILIGALFYLLVVARESVTDARRRARRLPLYVNASGTVKESYAGPRNRSSRVTWWVLKGTYVFQGTSYQFSLRVSPESPLRTSAIVPLWVDPDSPTEYCLAEGPLPRRRADTPVRMPDTDFKNE